MHTLLVAGAGYVLGAFTPAVGRKIKAFFVKESAVVKPSLVDAAAKIEKKL